MALNKKISNIIIGVDTENNVVKIISNKGSDINKMTVEDFSIDQKLLKTNSVSELVELAFEQCQLINNSPQAETYFVLPDHFVAIDKITLPIMKKVQLKDALKSEIKKFYPNLNELKINIETFSKNKKQIVYALTIIKKQILQECVTICKKHNLNLRNITYSSNCIVNSFLALGGKIKHSDCVLVDVQEKTTKIVYVVHDKTTCFANVPIGTAFLEEEENFSKNNISNENSFKEVFLSINSSNLGEKYVGKDEQNVQKQQFVEFKDKYETECENKNLFVQEKNGLSKIKKNFSVIMNYVSMFRYDVTQKYGVQPPEVVVVNMPEKLFEQCNMNDYGFKLVLLKKQLSTKCLLFDYFELYGAIYAVAYNKNQNFLDKE